MGVIPLTDVSRSPNRFPIVTAWIILINVVVFVLELAGGEPFVTRWALAPAEVASGHHLHHDRDLHVHARQLVPHRGEHGLSLGLRS